MSSSQKMTKGYPIIALATLLVAVSCRSPSPAKVLNPLTDDSTTIFRLLANGDSLYALKQDYQSFANALMYYDSAARLADTNASVGIKGYIAFSKASVYNAWNKEPQKTIELFKEAVRIFHTGKDEVSFRRAYYCRYLVAHAYDNEKGKDSVNCVRELNAIHDSLTALPRDRWAKWYFIPDLAWVATNVNEYRLAEKLLMDLTQRETICNDPTTNNYLDHYYLTRARIDVYQNKNAKSPYLDSLQAVYHNQQQNFDKLYYGQNLARLYAAARRFEQAFAVAQNNEEISSTVNDTAGISSLKNRLLQIRLESEQKDIVLKVAQHQNRIKLLWLLSGSLLIISLFSYRFFRGQKRYKEQSRKLEKANRQLDEKVEQIELMSKEVQHRIKNNLQMIQSLVYMQQRHTDSEEVKQNMLQIGLRIESIASLHQHLIEEDDETVDLKAYITRMLNVVVDLVDRHKRVTTHFDIDPVKLPMKKSFPLGLILNEWMTNSVKYAQGPTNTLVIHVTIKKEGRKLRVDYMDSGQAINQRDVKTGLGLHIIQLLNVQLNATLQQDPENYFHYHLLIDGAIN